MLHVLLVRPSVCLYVFYGKDKKKEERARKGQEEREVNSQPQMLSTALRTAHTCYRRFSFLQVWSNFYKLKTTDQSLWTYHQCWVHAGAEL